MELKGYILLSIAFFYCFDRIIDVNFFFQNARSRLEIDNKADGEMIVTWKLGNFKLILKQLF